MKKIIGALLLCFCMVVTTVPVKAFADDELFYGTWVITMDGNIHEGTNLTIGAQHDTREIIILDKNGKEFKRFKRNSSNVKIVKTQENEEWYIKEKIKPFPRLTTYTLVTIDKYGRKLKGYKDVFWLNGEEIEYFVKQIEELKKELEELKKELKIEDEKKDTTKSDELTYHCPLTSLSTFFETNRKEGQTTSSMFIRKWEPHFNDNVGNTYSNGIYITHNGGAGYWGASAYHKRTYLLNNKYKKLSGTLAVNYSAKNNVGKNCWAVVSFYGDGKLLYSSPVMKGGVKPVDFEFNLDNIEELVVEIEVDDVNFGIVDTKLYK